MVRSVAKPSDCLAQSGEEEHEHAERPDEHTEDIKSEARVQILNSTKELQTDKDEEEIVVPVVVDMVLAIVEDIAKRLGMKGCNQQLTIAEENSREWVDLCKQKTRMVALVFSLLSEPVLVARPSQQGPAQLAVCVRMKGEK